VAFLQLVLAVSFVWNSRHMDRLFVDYDSCLAAPSGCFPKRVQLISDKVVFLPPGGEIDSAFLERLCV